MQSLSTSYFADDFLTIFRQRQCIILSNKNFLTLMLLCLFCAGLILQNIQYFVTWNFMKQKCRVVIACLFHLCGKCIQKLSSATVHTQW